MFKDKHAVSPEQGIVLRDLALELLDLSKENRAWWVNKCVVNQIVVELGYAPKHGYELTIRPSRGWVKLLIAEDRVRLLEPARCLNYEDSVAALKACIQGWPERKPYEQPDQIELVMGEIRRLMEESGMSELEASRIVAKRLDRHSEGDLLHPDLNSRGAWVKRYQEVHGVDETDADIEYRRRRRAMNRFDISMIEYFSNIEKDPTNPINLRAFMSGLEAK